jgi:UDP-glucose 4-epimerase
MRWRGKKVLVAGGASFLGSHLVDKLVELNANVRVADDFSSGKAENLAKNIDHIEILRGNLKDMCFAKLVMKDVDLVFHLAASHGGRGYIDMHPVECCSNMALDGIVFESAFKAGVNRICFASSACVYPTDLQSKNIARRMLLLKEDMVDPFSRGNALADGEYGWAKLMGEMTLRAYHNEYGMKCSSCRIFTAYGERENETHAVIALIARAFIKMDPYVIWGTGEQDRNFTYVSDIIEGFILTMEKITDGSPVNIGTSEHIKIKEAAEKIFAYTRFRPRNILFDTSKPEGVFSRAADISKAKKILNWEPKVSFDNGLKQTIDWYYATKDKDAVAQKLQTLLHER